MSFLPIEKVDFFIPIIKEFGVNSVGKSSYYTRLKSKTFVIKYLRHKSFKTRVCIGQIPPPPDIPQAFDTFAVPERREFDYQNFPVGGEFDSHA